MFLAVATTESPSRRKFLIPLLCLTGLWVLISSASVFGERSEEQAAENPWIHLGLDGRTGVVYTKDPRFPTKTQLDLAIGGSFEVTPLSFFGLGFSFGHHWTKASGLEGGYRYRAHSGSDLRLYLTLRLALLRNTRTQLILGSNQGGLARFDSYDLTPLNFFYMGLFIHPYLELAFSKIPYLGFQLGFPIDYYVRKDLELSTSIGVGVGIKLSPLRESWE
jgi:hypothetical protein